MTSSEVMDVAADVPSNYLAEKLYSNVILNLICMPIISYPGLDNLIKKVEIKLEEFSQFEDDWDGEDGLRLDPLVANYVKLLVRSASSFIFQTKGAAKWHNPYLAPLSKGGINLGWEINGRKLVLFISPDLTAKYLRKFNQVFFDEGKVSTFDELLTLVLWLY